ncbi:hypothetical protein [Nonomuraea basaltis]|uniref:hypothetical protein n=1 Tax=Nonomuraea basaltis TaxID=2495887 RepID=UPI00110C6654|nr:hypothetical protein [Nonomuraea basaltis]TMR92579.1 hypothetical protein EJK15_44055 [Nonomuraea basaltis]
MSLLERITTRRAELSDQAQHLAKQLAEVEGELERMSVAEQVVTQMLAADDLADPEHATATAGFMMIPYRHQADGPDDLPADYQLLLNTVADANGALICKDICRAAGLSTEPGPVEGTRAKLNRLAERGWLRKTPAGSFARMS